MKILLIGDASNCHFSLSQGLASIGHDVTVASHGSRWMNTQRNIDLHRHAGKLGGLLFWVKLNTLLARDLKGYDIVHIHNPIFLDLRPHRVQAIFKKLRRDNGAVFLTALGTDSAYVDMCVSETSPLKYNEFTIEGKLSPYSKEHPERLKAWQSPPLSDHCKYIYENIDGAVAILYEYYLSCRRTLPEEMVGYAGIGIDTSFGEKNIKEPKLDGPLRIMLACHKGREIEKGCDVLLPIIRDFASENKGKVVIDFVQNRPFHEFQQILASADIVVDQLYSYSPATTALMAMSMGKVAVSGGEPEYYHFIGERELRPIINANPFNPQSLKIDLRELLDNREKLAALSKMGPAFVKKHNSIEEMAAKFSNFWERRLNR